MRKVRGAFAPLFFGSNGNRCSDLSALPDITCKVHLTSGGNLWILKCKASFTCAGIEYMDARIENLVKEYRTKADMTQQELADAAGVSRQSVISIERGRYVPSLQLALRLSAIFECSTDELFRLAKE